jgi:hypothetical protein
MLLHRPARAKRKRNLAWVRELRRVINERIRAMTA